MDLFSPHFFVVTLALVGLVIIIAALLSGLIDRSDLPQVGVFLALGAVLGPAGLGLLNVTLESPIVAVVATLSLVLVLFTDAVSLSLAEIRRNGRLAFLVLGPGTLLTAAMVALIGWLLLGLAPAAAVILGAALASTDPIMLRGLIRRPGLAEPVRLALRLESGLNDAVLLPIIFVAMPFLFHRGPPSGTEWARIGLEFFLLGPGAGIAVGTTRAVRPGYDPAQSWSAAGLRISLLFRDSVHCLRCSRSGSRERISCRLCRRLDDCCPRR